MRIAMLALLPGCSLYFSGGSSPVDGGLSPDDPVELELTTTQTMAAAHRIAGVDSDHAGGVWIAYQELTSSDLTITHLDAAKTVVTAWTYNDDQSEVSGIAVDDTGVWLNHNAIGTIGTNGVTKLDLSTGAKLFTFETQGHIADLEIQWGELVLSSYQNQVLGMDRDTGGLDSSMVTQVIPSTQKGVAAYGANVFVSSWDMETLTLMDKTGDILGTATSPLLHLNESASVGQFLANDGDRKLILASDSQIAWLTVASP
jgi:hypothetical protein